MDDTQLLDSSQPLKYRAVDNNDLSKGVEINCRPNRIAELFRHPQNSVARNSRGVGFKRVMRKGLKIGLKTLLKFVRCPRSDIERDLVGLLISLQE